MPKKIELEIYSCTECPYCIFNDVPDEVDKGTYDCTEAHKEIINEWDWESPNNPKRLRKYFDLIPIPHFCPLENA